MDLNRGLSPLGEDLIKRMLNIDQVSLNRAVKGARIIPDIKHMSTRTRKRYYEIVDQHNQQNPNNIIPVIMSHAAVNGKPSLDQDLNPGDEAREWDESSTFNPWSINLYDDEILRIHDTGGLIGMIFDQRVLAGGEKLRQLKASLNQNDPDNYFNGQNRKRRWAILIVDQIHHIVKTVKDSGRADWAKAWDRICIGSDFDGQIDPIDAYNRAQHFTKFRRVFQRLVKRDPRFDHLKAGLPERILADKICGLNVYDFLRRHFQRP